MPEGSRTEKKSQIPVGTQFSPNLIDLPAYVKMVVAYSGNIDVLKEKVVLPPVRKRPYTSSPTKRMKGLPLEAGVQYGLLIERTYQATDFAKELAGLKESQIYEAFARHGFAH